MPASQAHIIVKIDTANPIELGDFVAEFTSVSSQYEKFMSDEHPELRPGAQMFVTKVRSGSIIFELLPFAPLILFGNSDTIIHQIEAVNAVNEFIKFYGEKLRSFLGNGAAKETNNSDLKDLMGTVAAIAKDPKGKASIESVVFEDGKRKVRAAIRFDTKQANRAVKKIEAQQRKLEKRGHVDHPRVLMIFRQTNVKNPPLGKRTGEWVTIEDISDKELPLIYASELAEQQIKHEITHEEDNVFKKGFVVDVNLQTRGDRPVAYRVTSLHQVIDLPDTDADDISPPQILA